MRVAPRLPDVHSVLSAPGALTLDDLSALAGPIVKESLRLMIQATPDDRFGIPDAARRDKLAELDAAIADVERQHTALVDGAAEVGLTLPLLEAVKARRAEAAERAARERELAAERAKGADRVGA